MSIALNEAKIWKSNICFFFISVNSITHILFIVDFVLSFNHQVCFYFLSFKSLIF